DVELDLPDAKLRELLGEGRMRVLERREPRVEEEEQRHELRPWFDVVGVVHRKYLDLVQRDALSVVAVAELSQAGRLAALLELGDPARPARARRGFLAPFGQGGRRCEGEQDEEREATHGAEVPPRNPAASSEKVYQDSVGPGCSVN